MQMENFWVPMTVKPTCSGNFWRMNELCNFNLIGPWSAPHSSRRYLSIQHFSLSPNWVARWSYSVERERAGALPNIASFSCADHVQNHVLTIGSSAASKISASCPCPSPRGRLRLYRLPSSGPPTPTCIARGSSSWHPLPPSAPSPCTRACARRATSPIPWPPCPAGYRRCKWRAAGIGTLSSCHSARRTPRPFLARLWHWRRDSESLPETSSTYHHSSTIYTHW